MLFSLLIATLLVSCVFGEGRNLNDELDDVNNGKLNEDAVICGWAREKLINDEFAINNISFEAILEINNEIYEISKFYPKVQNEELKTILIKIADYNLGDKRMAFFTSDMENREATLKAMETFLYVDLVQKYRIVIQTCEKIYGDSWSSPQ